MVVTARAGLGDEEATEWIEADATLGTTMHLGRPILAEPQRTHEKTLERVQRQEDCGVAFLYEVAKNDDHFLGSAKSS
jgi:hypothetical protein